MTISVRDTTMTRWPHNAHSSDQRPCLTNVHVRHTRTAMKSYATINQPRHNLESRVNVIHVHLISTCLRHTSDVKSQDVLLSTQTRCVIVHVQYAPLIVTSNTCSRWTRRPPTGDGHHWTFTDQWLDSERQSSVTSDRWPLHRDSRSIIINLSITVRASDRLNTLSSDVNFAAFDQQVFTHTRAQPV